MRTYEEWSLIDSELCKVIDFTPQAAVKNGKVLAHNISEPYASVTLECKKIPAIITGYITHKVDFIHLWAAFKERTIKQDEEVIIVWTTKCYKNIIYRKLSHTMPKLIIMVCPKKAFEIISDSNYKPELRGEARFLAEKPIVEWKPEVMK